MTLVAQLVHISDLHLATLADQAQARRSGWASLFSSVLPWLAGGMMGHDHSALDEFEEALSYVLLEKVLGTNAPPRNPGVTAEVKSKTWLVCTGDLSTFGDSNGRVQMGLDWLEYVATKKGVPYCVIYGNHDVWDGGVPADSTEQALTANRAVFRSRAFRGTWPLTPIARGPGACGTSANPAFRMPLPHTKRELVITSLNTVAHERLPNTLAYGKVVEDRYWTAGGAPPHQLSELPQRARPNELRFVLTHHPVHYPGKPPVGMALINEAQVAGVLTQRVGPELIGTVVLSGHTHATFPPPLSLAPLPASNVTVQHPLGVGQAQLVAGCLSQRPHGRSVVRHDFSCIRLYEDPDGTLELEREVWRRHGPGPSGRFLPIADAHGQWVEAIRLG